MNQRTRIVIVLLLLGLLAGMSVHAASTADQRWPYPTVDDLATEYDAHVGDEVLLFGTVTAVTEETITITVTGAGTRLSIRVVETAETPAVGATVQVYGTLDTDQTVTADRVVIVNEDPRSELYKYAVSGIGAVGYLLVFFRRWRIDLDEACVGRRSDG